MTNSSEQETPDSNESSVGAEGVENAPSVPVELDFEGEAESAAVDSSAEIEKWKDVAARATADLDNFRKRMAREKFEAIQYANRGLLEQLLPIIDNFEMGLKAAESAEGSGSIILQGMSMVRKQLEDFLGEQGVEIVASDGVAFDPNVHEALKQENHESAPEGQVLYTMRRGYRLKDRLLRAANVVVSAGPGTES
ncbi:MAG: nucleotide exchange factor GrpE [Verrucomicrobiia bacterium Tous-C2TDCM]|nr:MAG: nucleotide exchange factor GrpE [Verrucomicrobiae bacterium Tous-C2TDCM]